MLQKYDSTKIDKPIDSKVTLIGFSSMPSIQANAMIFEKSNEMTIMSYAP